MKKIIASMLALSMAFALCGCGHEHSWVEATCTEPKTCSECGETEGEALGHTWTEATCTEPKTCSVCGETEGEALGHTWTEATCTEPKTCSVCGETDGEALGHTWVEATCTEPKTCSVCGETEGEALGHTWVEATYHAAKTCSVCGETEGSPKPSFFEEHGISVSTHFTEVHLTSRAVNSPYNPTVIEYPDTRILCKSNTVLPSERDGYKRAKVVFDGRCVMPPYTDGIYSPIGDLCDYYTGVIFPSRDTEGDESVELTTTVQVDGKSYAIYYSLDMEWIALGEWSQEDNAYYMEYLVTYYVDFPEDYDGLVLFLENIDEGPSEDNTQINYDVRTVDPANHSARYFRIG